MRGRAGLLAILLTIGTVAAQWSADFKAQQHVPIESVEAGRATIRVLVMAH